jgi:hypothetical protein
MDSEILKRFSQALIGQQVDQELAGANPYKPFEAITDAVNQRLLQGAARGEDSTRDLVIGGLLSGIGGGLFSNLSEDYADTQRGRLLSAAGDIYAGKDVARPTGISSGLFNQLQTGAALGKLSEVENEKEAARALTRAVQAKALEQEIQNNPGFSRKILEGMGLPASPTAEAIQTPAPENELFPGVKSIDQKIMERAAQLKQELPQLTANAALQEARKSVQADVLAEKGSIDTVADVRKSTRQMDEFLAQAEAGVAGAGKTGGFFGPVRDFASKLYAVTNADEAAQRAAQADLDASAQKAVAALRVPGSGAQSDIEYKGLLSAVPNSNRTPEENQRLLEGMKVLVQDRKDYADFIEFYRSNTGTVRGADPLWDAYKKANPLIVKQGKELVPNLNRTSWRDFDFKSEKAARSETKQPSKAELIAEAKRRGLL